MADTMTQNMAQASAEKMPEGVKVSDAHQPRKGDQYRCERCGMELTVTADCKCNDASHVHLQCCDHPMILA